MAAYTYHVVHRATGERATVTWDREQGQVWGPLAPAVRAKARECAGRVLTLCPGVLDSEPPHLRSDHGLLCLLAELGWEFAPAAPRATSPEPAAA
ncbi:MAG: hypothetical protein D6739_04390 [Nitrospirae bacterium]|nr:MAG: hypothetical protein D6739_04390 [Nitrospirota bacterium]